MKKICFLFVLTGFCLYSQNSFNKDVIGYSVKKNPIEVYKFGKGNDLILIFAGIHGNEENTSKSANELINLLKEKKIEINDNKSIWIIPESNPDGLARGRRLNENDVDLNRNFATDSWQEEFVFYNNVLSAGKKPFSEPETIVIKDFLEKIKNEYKIVVLSIHSAGNAIIAGNDAKYNKILMSYLYENSDYYFKSVGYNASGDMTEYISDKLKISAVTIELKTKQKAETEELVNVINQLQKVDFDKKIYNSGFDLGLFAKENSFEKIDLLINDLPKNNIEKIKATSGTKLVFVQNYDELDKDEELLLLVNKTHLLSQKYIPKDLVTLKTEFSSNKASFQFRKTAIPDLKNMFDDAKKDGINLKIVSSYRSYTTQIVVFEGWKKKYGEKEALRISAPPGASQHQLGTAIDFNSLDEKFENSKEGKWLYENAYKYGFILSFPKGMENITGYKYEPWHYRYIGKEAAYLVYTFFDGSLELFLNWYWSKK
jgi:zinc D-Ala-D-Ala carboxypeptidase